MTNTPINTSNTTNTLLTILDKLDKSTSHYIHCLTLPTPLEYPIYLCARLFNPDFISTYLITILLTKSYLHNDNYFFLKPLTHTLTCLIITLLLKKHFARPRPLNRLNIKRITNLRKHESNCSMPSGDSLQAANFAVIIYSYYGNTLGFSIVPLVMFARIFYHCHYIFDTIVGILIGFSLSYLIYFALN